MKNQLYPSKETNIEAKIRQTNRQKRLAQSAIGLRLQSGLSPRLRDIGFLHKNIEEAAILLVRIPVLLYMFMASSNENKIVPTFVSEFKVFQVWRSQRPKDNV